MNNIINYWHWPVFIGLLFYFYRVYEKQIRENNGKQSIAVIYEPPKGLSLLQSAFILDKSPDEKDITAAIMELGSLGYLTIKTAGREASSVLDKIKQYFSSVVLLKTNKNSHALTRDQRIVLRAMLFKKSNKFVLSNKPEAQSLEVKKEIPYLNEKLYSWAVEQGYLVENILKARVSFFLKNLLLLTPIIILTYFTMVHQYGNTEKVSTAILLLLVFSVWGIGGLIIIPSLLMKFGIFLFCSAGAFLPYLMLYKEGYSINELAMNLLLGPYGMIMISVVIMSLLSLKMGKLTAKGSLVQRQLLGLKEYIKRVKKNEIQHRLKENSLYLEKLLPYAVLFGETGQWLPLFKSLKAPQAVWHEGDIAELMELESIIKSKS